MINVINTDIEGVVINEDKVYGDSRGYFLGHTIHHVSMVITQKFL